jgi:hypothetical protein
MKNTSWGQDLEEAMEFNGETWDDVEAHTLTETQLNEVFDHGFGGTNGDPFTLWTKNFVYFPACYDGSEWVASVARNPDGKATGHIGGGS